MIQSGRHGTFNFDSKVPLEVPAVCAGKYTLQATSDCVLFLFESCIHIFCLQVLGIGPDRLLFHW